MPQLNSTALCPTAKIDRWHGKGCVKLSAVPNNVESCGAPSQTTLNHAERCPKQLWIMLSTVPNNFESCWALSQTTLNHAERCPKQLWIMLSAVPCSMASCYFTYVNICACAKKLCVVCHWYSWVRLRGVIDNTESSLAMLLTNRVKLRGVIDTAESDSKNVLINFTFNARERLYFISISSCVSIA